MSSHLPTQTEKAVFYRRIIWACRRSVVRVSFIVALVVVLLKGGGLWGGMFLYLISAAASTVGMCIVCLCWLPLIFMRPRLPHPAVISLVTCLVLAQAAFIVMAMLYGVPVGFYLKPGVTRHPAAPVSAHP